MMDIDGYWGTHVSLPPSLPPSLQPREILRKQRQAVRDMSKDYAERIRQKTVNRRSMKTET